ncbi:MAG: hypothetical protein SFY81_10185 [Verrucomicrobiota bacterium]|nr:hypothetical protein [Verrucomicrobiota bacterium]
MTSRLDRLFLQKIKALFGQFLAAAFLIGASLNVSAANELLNAGFETGTLGNWNSYGNAVVESTNNTYFNNGSSQGASNVLTHTGRFVFKSFGQFNGTDSYNGVLQDKPSAPGALWVAEGYALTHIQDRLQGNNTAWLEVSFRNADDQPLALYRSIVLDRFSEPTTWHHLKVTNQISIEDFTSIIGTATELEAPEGSTLVRFQVVFRQPGTADGGSVYFDDLVLDKRTIAPVDIISSPTDLTRTIGQTAAFTVSASGTDLTYQWLFGTEPLTEGGQFSGVSSPTLIITDVQMSNRGQYSVVVSDGTTSLKVGARLTVQTVEEAANLLENPGFESGAFTPWIAFNGAAVQASTNRYFYFSEQFHVHSGFYVSHSFHASSFNGFYQDKPVQPGKAYSAEGWGLTPADDYISDANRAWIEVSFRDQAGNVLSLYRSGEINANSSPSQWSRLKVTNVLNTQTFQITNSTPVMFAPANASFARYQVVYQGVRTPESNGGGSVVFDDMRMFPKIPVTLTGTRVGSNFQLQFASLPGTSYTILTKLNLADDWQTRSTIQGDGTGKSYTEPLGTTNRFFSVIAE